VLTPSSRTSVLKFLASVSFDVKIPEEAAAVRTGSLRARRKGRRSFPDETSEKLWTGGVQETGQFLNLLGINDSFRFRKFLD